MVINKSNLGFAVILIFAPCVFPDVYLDFSDSAIVNDTVITIGDVAKISGTDCRDSGIISRIEAGEAAPAGYSRFLNSSEIVKRIAGGKKFGNIKSSCENKRLKVRTGYKEKCVGDFEKEINGYVADRIAWQAEDYRLDIINSDEKWKFLNKPFSIEICGVTEKYPKGNVNFKLVAVQETRRYPVNVVCKISVVTPVVIANSTVKRNSLFNEANCSVEKRDITNFGCTPCTRLSEVCGKTASRTVSAGTIINEKVIARIPDIECDEQVQVIVTNGRVKISMAALAREAGFCGDKIWVENEMTHRLLRVKVVEHGKVALIMGEEVL